jgi:YegS/Rv2252/BmrU family lipid kinase
MTIAEQAPQTKPRSAPRAAPQATKVRIFVNSSSGWEAREDAPQRLRELFTSRGWDTEVHSVSKGTNITELAQCAIDEGCGVVVAGGGDGTLNAVASALAGTDTSFGVLPVGTLNHFARDLNIPLDLDAAADVVLTGRPTRVDVGDVNGRVFLNNAIIGLYPEYRFIKDRQERRGRHRWLAFLSAAAAIFRRYPFLAVRMTVDGCTQLRRTPYILVANNQHAMQGYQLGTRHSLSEGKLWIYVMKRQSRWGLIRMVLNLMLGRFSAEQDFEIFEAAEAWVETRRKRRLGVSLDGEIALMDTPLHFRSLPGSLNVIVPKG